MYVTFYYVYSTSSKYCAALHERNILFIQMEILQSFWNLIQPPGRLAIFHRSCRQAEYQMVITLLCVAMLSATQVDLSHR